MHDANTRPWWRTGSLIPEPDGIRLTFTPSGMWNAARTDVLPSNFAGHIGWAGVAEPGYLTPTESPVGNLSAVPPTYSLPDLAGIIRRFLGQR